MNLFDITAVLVTLAALFSYVNFRLLRLPSTTGILSLALLSSFLMLIADAVLPGWNLRQTVIVFLARIDFNAALMQGMLCFLLFAGSLHLRFEDLRSNKWTIVALASLGVVLSTALVGFLAFGLFQAFHIPVPLPLCLVFGALISPTDPIAVLGLLKELEAPKELEAVIAGESLFNDGVGVVVFFALLPLAGLDGKAVPFSLDPFHLFVIFFKEVLGGVLLGLAFGYLAYRALKSINYHQLELLITLALVMITYSLAFRLEVSGPIAVVVAGLLIGNHGKRFAMSQKTSDYVDSFWGMMDDIMNAILFLLIGLVGFDPRLNGSAFFAALSVIPLVLASRFLSVLLPIIALQWKQEGPKGIVPLLTWGGLRGGLSIAMVLSLPPIPERGLLMTCTYAIVLFSVLVQGMSMRRLLLHYGVAGSK